MLLRLLVPCLRPALAFSSLQGEVRPYPSPSDGPAGQTHHSGGGDRLMGWTSNKPTVLAAFPTQQEAVEVARDITSLGPLSLPRPPALDKGQGSTPWHLRMLKCIHLKCNQDLVQTGLLSP